MGEKPVVAHNRPDCRQPSKPAYGSKADAKRAVKRAEANLGRRLKPYRCPCGWWHLTSQT